QDCLDGVRRHPDSVRSLDDDLAISFLKRQRLQALDRRAPRPAARIAGLTLAELRVPGRPATADVIGGGFDFAGFHGDLSQGGENNSEELFKTGRIEDE